MWSKVLHAPRKTVIMLLTLPAISFLVACFAFTGPAFAAQTVPYKLNFQGRLTGSSGAVLSGSYDMQLKFYTAVTGGTYIWGETRTAANANAVTVTNGLFSVLIGEGTAVAGSSATLQAAIAANQTMYLEVTVGVEILSPRNQMGASAYAINADLLDGLDGSSYAPASGSTNYAPISGSANYIQNQIASAQSADFNISGSGTVAGNFTNNGTALFKPSGSSQTAFSIQTSGSAVLFAADTQNSRIYIGNPSGDANAVLLVLDNKTGTGDPAGVNGGEYYNSTNNKFRCYQNSAWADCTSGFTSIIKQTDQPATANSTTLQDDNTLYFAMKASSTYVFDAWIPVNASNASADFKYAITVPTGTTFNVTAIANATICGMVTSGTACAYTAANPTTMMLKMSGVATTSTTAGNLQFRFAQNTATSGQNFPVIKKGAILSWRKTP